MARGYIYGCETWTLKASDRKRISAFEMTSHRRMLRISWKEHRTIQCPVHPGRNRRRNATSEGHSTTEIAVIAVFLGTRRERTTCARQSFMAGSVARNDEVVQEGDGQTTSETEWDRRSQNAQEWHRNENYGEQWCR